MKFKILLAVSTLLFTFISCQKQETPGTTQTTPALQKTIPSWDDTSGTSLFVYTKGWMGDRFVWTTLINDNGKTVALIDSSTDGYKKKLDRQLHFYYDAQGRLIQGGTTDFFYYDNNGRLEKCGEFELVDGKGKQRASIRVEDNGEVVFRLRDQNGAIRVKLGADKVGSGLLLLDGATNPGIHALAKKGASFTVQIKTGKRKPIDFYNTNIYIPVLSLILQDFLTA